MTYSLLACGVNRAPNQRPLHFAEKDAQDVHDTLTSALGPPLQRSDLLIGTAATSTQVELAFSAARGSTYHFFYFSGHGDADGMTLSNGHFPYELLADLIRMVGARCTFVVLDTCEAGAFQYYLTEGLGSLLGIEYESWYHVLANASHGSRIIASSGVGRSSGEGLLPDGRMIENGHFTHAFLRALREASGDGHFIGTKFISDRRAFSVASWLMRQEGMPQTPIQVRLRGDFPLTRSEKDQFVGRANIASTRIVRDELAIEVAVSIYGRRQLDTQVSGRLLNAAGKTLWAGDLVHRASRDAEAFECVARTEHATLLADPHSRRQWFARRQVTLVWEVTVRDAHNDIHDVERYPVVWTDGAIRW